MAPLKDMVGSPKCALNAQNLTFVKLHFTVFIADRQEKQKKDKKKQLTKQHKNQPSPNSLFYMNDWAMVSLWILLEKSQFGT